MDASIAVIVLFLVAISVTIGMYIVKWKCGFQRHYEGPNEQTVVLSVRFNSSYQILSEDKIGTDTDEHQNEDLRSSALQRSVSCNSETQTDKVSDIQINDDYSDIVEKWKETDKIIVLTRPFKAVRNIMQDKDFLTIIGPPGCGKSLLIQHLALQMNQNKGYTIVLAKTPSEIIERRDNSKNYVFVFDDVCGKYCMDPITVNNWELKASAIKQTMESNNFKILVTCRKKIFDEKLFKKVIFFSINVFDMSSQKFTLTPLEKKEILDLYVKVSDDDVNQIVHISDARANECFPLLCNFCCKAKVNVRIKLFTSPIDTIKEELLSLTNDPVVEKMFVLFMICNNCISFNNFTNETSKALFAGVETGAIKSKFTDLCKSVVIKIDDEFSIVHDLIFDILVSCIKDEYIDIIVDKAKSDVIKDRFYFQTPVKTNLEGCIEVPMQKEERYIYRLCTDIIDGRIRKVFSNRNMKFVSFRQRLIGFIRQNKEVLETLCTKCEKNDSPLLDMARNGYSDIVQFLLEIGLNVNIQDEIGRTPLFLASESGSTESVKLLLKNEASANISKEDIGHKGESPLHMACLFNHLDIVELLLEHNADSNSFGTDLKTPLHIAVENGNFYIVYQLLKHGASANTANEDRETPLYWAASRGEAKLVDILLHWGADLDIVDITNMSPLFVATEEGHTDIVKMLLENGANPDIPAVIDRTPLYKACENGDLNIAKLLLTFGADPNICAMGNLSPIFQATVNGHFDIVLVLLQFGANPDICTSEKKYPLCLASSKANFKLIELLLENPYKKADPNVCTPTKKSSLYIAAGNGQSEIVKLLLKNHADPNQTTNAGKTPLYTAALNGHESIVKYLLHNFADPNIETVDKDTPLKASKRQENTKITELLLQFKALDSSS